MLGNISDTVVVCIFVLQPIGLTSSSCYHEECSGITQINSVSRHFNCYDLITVSSCSCVVKSRVPLKVFKFVTKIATIITT